MMTMTMRTKSEISSYEEILNNMESSCLSRGKNLTVDLSYTHTNILKNLSGVKSLEFCGRKVEEMQIRMY